MVKPPHPTTRRRRGETTSPGFGAGSNASRCRPGVNVHAPTARSRICRCGVVPHTGDAGTRCHVDLTLSGHAGPAGSVGRVEHGRASPSGRQVRCQLPRPPRVRLPRSRKPSRSAAAGTKDGARCVIRRRHRSARPRPRAVKTPAGFRARSRTHEKRPIRVSGWARNAGGPCWI